MGLDMYLYKANNNGEYSWQNNEVGYWRKANQIHLWFVKNVQNGVDNCGDYAVSKEQVEELLDICNTILDNVELVSGKIKNGQRMINGQWIDNVEDGKYMKDSSIAEKLLPTREGFFFGSTDYDEWYVNDLKDTVKILNDVLDSFDFENNKLIYSSSW